MKANVLATGYSQDLLDQPIAKTITPNDVMFTAYRPVELGRTRRSRSSRPTSRSTPGITGVPDYGAYTGYIVCDMAITGLKNAGKNPTRQGFVDGIRKPRRVRRCRTARAPIDVGYENFGKIARDELHLVRDRQGRQVQGAQRRQADHGQAGRRPEARRGEPRWDRDDDHDCTCRLRGAAMTSSTESRRVEHGSRFRPRKMATTIGSLSRRCCSPRLTRFPNVRRFSWKCRAPVTAVAISISRRRDTAKPRTTTGAARSWSHWTTSG